MTIGQRLAELRKRRSITQPMLAEKLSVSASTIASWENDRRGIGNEDLIKLAKFFGVTTDYLLTLEPDTKGTDSQPDFEVTEDNVAVYGEIHAGDAAWAEQNIIGKVPVSKSVVMRYGKNNLFALRIKGDSMNHVLLDGYVAVFAKDTTIENNDIVAVLIDHEDATIKRFTQTSAAVIFEPDSTNPTHQPYFFPKTEPQDFEILGKYIYATTQLI